MKRILIPALIVLGLTVAACGTTDDMTAISDNGQQVSVDQLAAFDVCKQFVAERLRSPGSAKWRDPLGDQVSIVGTGLNESSVTISASVDSENGFGALLRTRYVCRVHQVSGDRWLLDDLNLKPTS